MTVALFTELWWDEPHPAVELALWDSGLDLVIECWRRPPCTNVNLARKVEVAAFATYLRKVLGVGKTEFFAKVSKEREEFEIGTSGELEREPPRGRLLRHLFVDSDTGYTPVYETFDYVQGDYTPGDKKEGAFRLRLLSSQYGSDHFDVALDGAFIDKDEKYDEAPKDHGGPSSVTWVSRQTLERMAEFVERERDRRAGV